MVPVILLTGFLGSGKTTLLNRLLAARQARPGRGKLAVLVNELGSIGIDAALLPDGARQVELAGGCICCTLDENLSTSLTDLVDSDPAIELIVVETTGIAEPLPIVWTLGGELLSSRVRLAAVVTVVDPTEHERSRPLAPAVDNQVEHADLLIVSKLDLIPPYQAYATARDVERLLREKNRDAPVVAERGPRASAEILLALLEGPTMAWGAPGRLRAGAAATFSARDHARARDTGADSGLAHNHDIDPDRPTEQGALSDDAHPHGFETIALPVEGTLDFEELSDRLAALPPSYVRIKGICWAIDRELGNSEPRLIAFHRVGARVSAEALSPASAAHTRPRAWAVALGFGIEPGPLAACLRAAVIPSDN